MLLNTVNAFKNDYLSNSHNFKDIVKHLNVYECTFISFILFFLRMFIINLTTEYLKEVLLRFHEIYKHI